MASPPRGKRGEIETEMESNEAEIEEETEMMTHVGQTDTWTDGRTDRPKQESEREKR